MIMYIVTGHGVYPRGHTFYVNRNLLSLRSFATSLKTISLMADFIHFFMIISIFIAPGQWLTTTWERNFDVNRTSCHFGHLLQVLKQISLKSDFIHLFRDFIHVYSPGAGAGAGADSPQGTKYQ